MDGNSNLDKQEVMIGLKNTLRLPELTDAKEVFELSYNNAKDYIPGKTSQADEVIGKAEYRYLMRNLRFNYEYHCAFQLIDQATARRNEKGENAHALYKARQHRVVASRLKRGAR